MSYFSTKVADKTSAYVEELLADTEADLATIPIELLSPGSTCIIADTATVYILNTKKQWVLL